MPTHVEKCVSGCLATHGVKLSTDAEKMLLQYGGDTSALTVKDLYQKVLNANLCDVCEPGVLPRDLGSQPTTTLKSQALVQIQASRDATQPLRPCADMEEEEVALGAAAQRNTNRRLLRLTVTDGHVEVPAVELDTQLRIFPQIPFPGLKLLLKEGTQIVNGMVLIDAEHVKVAGGGVDQLKQEFVMRRNRLAAAFHATSGLDGAPKFEPLHAVLPPGRGLVAKTPAATGHVPKENPEGQSAGDGHRGRHGGHHEKGRGRDAHHGQGHGTHKPPGSGRGSHHHQHRGGGHSIARGGGGSGRRTEHEHGRGRGGRGSYSDPQGVPVPAAAPPPSQRINFAARNYVEEFPSIGGDW